MASSPLQATVAERPLRHSTARRAVPKAIAITASQNTAVTRSLHTRADIRLCISEVLAQTKRVVDGGVDVVHRHAVADAKQRELSVAQRLRQRGLGLRRVEGVDVGLPAVDGALLELPVQRLVGEDAVLDHDLIDDAL